MPWLILLDLNMPVIDGSTFLEELQNHEWYKSHEVLVAVLTTSLNPTDQERVQALGINKFINKPLTKELLQKLVQGIAN
ncbi:response regulator [Pontibacter sp. H249]|uniref:response regulator n=1 Tax=Pontibacter sp. H249 TaxID=3133420 RepID=UPI0030BB3D6C